MRTFSFSIVALAATAMCAPASATNTFSAAEYAKAAAALEVMKNVDLFVIEDATLHSDVEGKVYVGGNLTGNNSPVAIGNASKSDTASPINRSLTVGGDLVGGITVNNGIGVSNIEVAIGGNASSVGINMGSAASAKVLVGGSFDNQNFNPTGNKTAVYGTTASNVQAQDSNSVKQDATIKAGGTADLKAMIASVTAVRKDEVTTLSNVLGALSTNATLSSTDQNNIHFDYAASAATDAFVVANVTASQLSSGTFKAPTSNKTMIINVSGPSVSIGANMTGNWASTQQSIIWNFTDAASVSVNVALFGSVLAPKATITGNSPINGSVVAKVFNSNGEVHLGTFNGVTPFLVPTIPGSGVGSVPEPASWLTMLLGFGFTGSIIRSLRRKERLAAA